MSSDGTRPVLGEGAVSVVRLDDATRLGDCLAVRLEVFVEEQRVPLDEEIDALDDAATTTHLLALDADGTVLGTARVLADPEHPGEIHVGRVAVRAIARGRGVGRALMHAAHAVALADHGVDGAVRSVLSAQVQAFGFYESLGYTVVGETYLDAGIEHRDAYLDLARPPAEAKKVGGSS
ncbi:GNAT family N-acetyltransferase [Sanguibacter sp. A247]|uniref:GNAT family N-acetyltransferase n=1 Tax=unclassified Sanguibacter TaxID=2645534 RepID=UPI003FD7E0B9